MDIVIERRGLQDAMASDCRLKSILVDVMYADPHAGAHLRAGSAHLDRSAAPTLEVQKRTHCARPGHVSFDEHSRKIVSIGAENVARLGRNEK